MHDQTVTVAAPVCVLSDPDGQIRPSGVTGVYVSDVRVLRRAELSLSAGQLVDLGSSYDGTTTTFHAVVLGVGDVSPDPTVRIERVRTARPDGVDEFIRIRSTAVEPVRLAVTLAMQPELTPLQEVREGGSGRLVPADFNERGARWGDAGLTAVLTTDAAVGDRALRWTVDLEHGQERVLGWSLRVRDTRGWLTATTGPVPWSVPTISSGDPRLSRLVHRALEDLAALRLTDAVTPDGVFIGAGVPWFLTLFGRDSIWAARMMLPLGTGLAEGTLRTLANRQGTRTDEATCEEPGKIMHELRRDQIWGLAPEPQALEVYFGTVDATMLWISLLADAWRRGLPDETVTSFLPNLLRALSWMSAFGDEFISYVDRTGRGLANQGWKDSGTSVRFRDGRMATPPIALCEVQGYAHRAALDAADLLDAFGLPDADRWRAYAGRLAARFRARFWVDSPLGPHPALALDADGRPVDSLTSNIGHLLGTGMLSGAEESAVARLLGSPALAGGYGLRTMSTLDAAYDPMSYHCGAIWPHDTAIALLGLAAMPGDPDARTAAASLIDGLLIAGEAFDYRLPELYAGDDRADRPRPLPHPAACRPQAWSAAAAIAVWEATRRLAAVPSQRSG
jgi:glycogen debranching enzyme